MTLRQVMAAAALAAGIGAAFASCGGGSPIKPSPGGGNGGGVTNPPNTPPVVKSITASDTRVEVGSPVTLTASVEDAETPIANLTYKWTADNGTFTGDGATVAWTPGADAKTPGDFVVTLTVTEPVSTNPGGVVIENKATGTLTVHVNNSPKELAELSLRFLGDFANSKILPDACVAEFSDTTEKCARGKKDERADIDDNRHDFEILEFTLRHTGLSIDSSRVAATVHTFCSFKSKVITENPRDECGAAGTCKYLSVGTATGDCWTTNVYEKGRWFLCESHFSSQASLTSPGTFIPNLFRRQGF